MTLLELVVAKSATFYAKLNLDGYGCWVWTGPRGPVGLRRPGYGQFSLGKRRVVRAHRAAWMLYHRREIPAGMVICHTCDNPICCEPQHLWLGTVAENNADRAAKGRTVRPDRDEGAVAYARGEAHGSAKLTADQARAIFLDKRPLAAIAAEYGINFGTVSKIRLGKKWGSVTRSLVPEGDLGLVGSELPSRDAAPDREPSTGENQ